MQTGGSGGPAGGSPARSRPGLSLSAAQIQRHPRNTHDPSYCFLRNARTRPLSKSTPRSLLPKMPPRRARHVGAPAPILLLLSLSLSLSPLLLLPASAAPLDVVPLPYAPDKYQAIDAEVSAGSGSVARAQALQRHLSPLRPPLPAPAPADLSLTPFSAATGTGTACAGPTTTYKKTPNNEKTTDHDPPPRQALRRLRVQVQRRRRRRRQRLGRRRRDPAARRPLAGRLPLPVRRR